MLVAIPPWFLVKHASPLKAQVSQHTATGVLQRVQYGFSLTKLIWLLGRHRPAWSLLGVERQEVVWAPRLLQHSLLLRLSILYLLEWRVVLHRFISWLGLIIAIVFSARKGHHVCELGFVFWNQLFEFKEDFQRTLLGYLWSLILNGWVEDAVFRQV